MFKSKGSIVKIAYTDYLERQSLAYFIQDKAKKTCSAKILDPIPYLCDNKYCYGSRGGIPLYFDDGHLSKYGAELISTIYSSIFE